MITISIDMRKVERPIEKRGTSFSVVPQDDIRLTKGIFLKTSFWNRGTSDRYRETPRPAVIPQIARVGLKRLMTLFVGTFVLSYRRGCGGRDDDWQEVVVTIEIDTDEMDDSCVGVIDSRRMV
jgi:hypothetical protein